MDKHVREEVLALIEEKEKLENEIMEVNQILLKNKVGMNDPLVDKEGFPFSHIDVYQVRHARHLLIHKQNDHKALMKQIEQGISEYYSGPPAPTVAPPPTRSQPGHITPFARVTIVQQGSPAYLAGIEDGDLLVEFGSVNAENFRSLQDIGNVVQHSEGHKIHVVVVRSRKLIKLCLTPKKWSGLGLLGCTVNPC